MLYTASWSRKGEGINGSLEDCVLEINTLYNSNVRYLCSICVSSVLNVFIFTKKKW